MTVDASLRHAQADRPPIGRLFVDQGLISEADLEQALADQTPTLGRLGEILVLRGLISPTQLTDVLIDQLGEQLVNMGELQPGRSSMPRADAHDSRRRGRPDDGSTGAERPSAPDPGEPEGDTDANHRATKRELDRVRADLKSRSEAVIALTGDLEKARLSLIAREVADPQEARVWQSARLASDGLDGELTRQGSNVSEIRARAARRSLIPRGRLRRRVEQAERELAVLGDDVAAHAASLAALEERAAGYGRRVAVLEAEATELVERRVAAEAETVAERDRRDSIRQTLDDALVEQTRLRTAQREAEAGLEALRATHAAALTREARANAEAVSLRERNAALILAWRQEREEEAARLAEARSCFAEEAARHTETRAVLAQALDELTVVPLAPGLAGQADSLAEPEHVCFVPGTDGYQFLTRSGPEPGIGDSIELGGRRYAVVKIGRSPLPFDRRRCAYLQDQLTPLP